MYKNGLGIDVLVVEISHSLYKKVKNALKKRLPAELLEEFGYILPDIKIKENSNLKDGEYSLYVRQVPVFCAVYENEEKFVCDLKNEFIKNVKDIFSLKELQKYYDFVKKTSPLANLDHIEPVVVKRVLTNLLREKVSVKDIVYIFEQLSDFSQYSINPYLLSERLRSALGRSICYSCLDKDGVLHVINLSPITDNYLKEHIEQTELTKMFLLSPRQIASMVPVFTNIWEKFSHKNPVILCDTNTRLALYDLLEKYIPNIRFLSYSELVSDISVEVLGEIEVNFGSD